MPRLSSHLLRAAIMDAQFVSDFSRTRFALLWLSDSSKVRTLWAKIQFAKQDMRSRLMAIVMTVMSFTRALSSFMVKHLSCDVSARRLTSAESFLPSAAMAARTR